MGEYEPEDSRIVTHSTHTAPGEPPRTGPREGEARRKARQAEAEEERAESAPGEPLEQDLNTARLERGAPLGEG